MRKTLQTILFMSVLGLCIVSLPECKNNPTSSTSNDTFPASNISYGKYIQPILSGYCNYTGCHNSFDQAGNPPLILETYHDVTALAGIVVAGKSTGSILYLRIHGDVQPQMPPYPYPLLSANKIKAIKTWIDEGAKQN